MLATWIQSKKDEDGFTLIELLVVVIIIGILAAIAIPVFLNQRENAWRGAAESDARNAAIEVESFMTQTGTYPTAAEWTSTVLPRVQTSQSVTLTYAVDDATNPTEYSISGSNAQIQAGQSHSCYQSSQGGLVRPFTAGQTCPADGTPPA